MEYKKNFFSIPKSRD